MRTAQYELRRTHHDAPKPIPTFIDVNTDCQSIIVDAPVAEVYRRCLRFEEFPRFITSITSIDEITDTRFSCRSIIDGEEVQSDVQIIMRVPERRIAWQAISDNFRVGVVFFDPLLDGTTKVTVKVRSIIEPVMLTGALRHYLRNLKTYIENSAGRK